MNHFENLKKAVASSGVDAMLLFGEANRFYATGFRSTDGAAVVTADKAYFFTDSRYIEAAQKTITGAEVLEVDGNKKYIDRINDVIYGHGVKSLGFEEDALTYGEYSRFKNSLKAEFVPAQKLMSDLRASKDEEEIAIMIEAQRIAEKSFNEILPLISTDITEKQLATELLYRMLSNGAEDKSFDTIIVSAEKSSMPHGVPGDVKIKEGFLTIDFGCIHKGYCSDTTRTLCVGKPTDEMRKIYDTVLEAQLAGIEKAAAGVEGYEIDKAGRDVIEKAGYGKCFGHGFGHSLGIEIHEDPRASSACREKMPAGAVISAEPGIYLPGKFGVRIEDVLVLEENGCRNITNLPKELIVV